MSILDIKTKYPQIAADIDHLYEATRGLDSIAFSVGHVIGGLATVIEVRERQVREANALNGSLIKLVEERDTRVAELETRLTLAEGKALVNEAAGVLVSMLHDNPHVVRLNLMRGTLARPDDICFMNDELGPYQELKRKYDDLKFRMDGLEK